MTKKELQLEYLNNFIKRWELFNDKSDNKGMGLMTDELRYFCEANNLPFISADEIPYSKVQTYRRRDFIG